MAITEINIFYVWHYFLFIILDFTFCLLLFSSAIFLLKFYIWFHFSISLSYQFFKTILVIAPELAEDSYNQPKNSVIQHHTTLQIICILDTGESTIPPSHPLQYCSRLRYSSTSHSQQVYFYSHSIEESVTSYTKSGKNKTSHFHPFLLECPIACKSQFKNIYIYMWYIWKHCLLGKYYDLDPKFPPKSPCIEGLVPRIQRQGIGKALKSWAVWSHDWINSWFIIWGCAFLAIGKIYNSPDFSLWAASSSQVQLNFPPVLALGGQRRCFGWTRILCILFKMWLLLISNLGEMFKFSLLHLPCCEDRVTTFCHSDAGPQHILFHSQV